MRILLALALLGITTAGCISQSTPATVEPAAVPEEIIGALEPLVQEWSGHIVASPLGALAHDARTEGYVRDHQSEGFLVDVAEPPQVFQVELAWPGPGEALMMISSPNVEGKGVEYFSEMAGAGEQCLRIKPDEVTVGKWQVMIHTGMSAGADYTFKVTTLGGDAKLLDEPHSSSEAAETTEGEALPCDAPAEA